MKITVAHKNVFGRDIFYPKCNLAAMFAELLNQETLTKDNILNIQKMGYAVQYTA